jgi:hypothetical protein
MISTANHAYHVPRMGRHPHPSPGDLEAEELLGTCRVENDRRQRSVWRGSLARSFAISA